MVRFILSFKKKIAKQIPMDGHLTSFSWRIRGMEWLPQVIVLIDVLRLLRAIVSGFD